MAALPPVPPRYDSWAEMAKPIKKGDTGWPTFAVQRVLSFTKPIECDGIFGDRTQRALKNWQKKNGLTGDGVAGPSTQTKMCSVCCDWVQKNLPKLPRGAMQGLVNAESSGFLGCTNWYTPPGGQSGVDCGVVQWRVYGPPFEIAQLREAFDARHSIYQAGEQLLLRAVGYKDRRPSLSDKTAFKLAILAHNAPFLAEQYVRNGHLTSPNSPAQWTSKPGGGNYTQGEWFDVYTDRILSGK